MQTPRIPLCISSTRDSVFLCSFLELVRRVHNSFLFLRFLSAHPMSSRPVVGTVSVSFLLLLFLFSLLNNMNRARHETRVNASEYKLRPRISKKMNNRAETCSGSYSGREWGRKIRVKTLLYGITLLSARPSRKNSAWTCFLPSLRN